MIKKAKDIWKGLLNVLKPSTDNKKYLSHRKIEDTPFHITGSPDQGYSLTIGGYRITEPTPTAEEAALKLDEEAWLIVSRMISTYIDYYDKMTKGVAPQTEEETEN